MSTENPSNAEQRRLEVVEGSDHTGNEEPTEEHTITWLTCDSSYIHSPQAIRFDQIMDGEVHRDQSCTKLGTQHFVRCKCKHQPQTAWNVRRRNCSLPVWPEALIRPCLETLGTCCMGAESMTINHIFQPARSFRFYFGTSTSVSVLPVSGLINLGPPVYWTTKLIEPITAKVNTGCSVTVKRVWKTS